MQTPNCKMNLDLLHDNQADISFIKACTIVNTNEIDKSNKIYIVGITPHRIEAIGSFDVQIKLGNHLISHSFFVMPDEVNIPTHGILGKDFLKHLYKSNTNNEHMILTLKINNEYIDLPILETELISNDISCHTLNSDRASVVLDKLQINNKLPNNDIISLCAQYHSIFHLKNERLTVNNFFQYKIKLLDQEPVYIKNYRPIHSQKHELNSQVNDLLKNGQIEKSIAPYNSPILLVPKKSGSNQPVWRLVTDYSCLNKKIVSDTYPLPRIDDILDQLGDNKFFSILDLSQGFHQIKITEDSRDCTTFSTPAGSFRWKVLPFGLKVSPSAFARMINAAFATLPYRVCFIYLDDIIIVGRTHQEHLNNIQQVFNVCDNSCLKLNPNKCKFFVTQVTYLGHKCSSAGVSPDESKFAAIKNYPRPQSKDEVKRFVAFANYYRRFIKDFANISAPLNFLTRKTAEFKWSDICEQNFQLIKSILISPKLLQYPDFTKNFILTCDASKIACGAVLSQVHNGCDMPVAYASKAFTKGESNKAPIEQELLAIYYGIKHFRPYVYGTKFTIRSDHKPLVYLFSLKDPSSRLTRLRLELEEYDFEVEYIKGSTNVVADALSRITLDDLKNISAFVCTVLPVTTRSMTRANNLQINENTIINEENHGTNAHQMVYEPLSINKQRFPRMRSYGTLGVPQASYDTLGVSNACLNIYKNYKGTKPLFRVNLYLNNHLIPIQDVFTQLEMLAMVNNLTEITFSLSDPLFKLISPEEFKTLGNNTLKHVKILLLKSIIVVTDNETKLNIITQYHNDPVIGGHNGQKRLLAKIANDYQWKNMRKDIINYVNQCHLCKVNKPKTSTVEPLCITPTPLRPFEKIIIDTLGPLVPSANNNTYALTAICDLTKYIITIPIPNKQANTVAKAIMNEIILIYGPMKSILSDKGTEFVNSTITELCSLLNIQNVHSAPYRHETVGSIERNHRSLNEYLRMYLNDSNLDWENFLKYFTYCYNISPHTAFNFIYTPFELVFSKKPVNMNHLSNNQIQPIYNIDNFTQEARYRLQLALKHANELLSKAKQQSKKIYDKKIRPINLAIGDKVMINDFTRHKILDPMFKGPFTVVEDKGHNVTLSNQMNNKIIEVHKNNVKKY